MSFICRNLRRWSTAFAPRATCCARASGKCVMASQYKKQLRRVPKPHRPSHQSSTAPGSLPRTLNRCGGTRYRQRAVRITLPHHSSRPGDLKELVLNDSARSKASSDTPERVARGILCRVELNCVAGAPIAQHADAAGPVGLSVSSCQLKSRIKTQFEVSRGPQLTP